MKNVYVTLCQHFSRTWSCNNLVRKYHITIVLYNIWSVFNAPLSVCATWLLIQILPFLPNMNQMVHTVWTLLASKYLASGLSWLKLHEKGKIALRIFLPKISTFVSYHCGPECPLGDLNIINSLRNTFSQITTNSSKVYIHFVWNVLLISNLCVVYSDFVNQITFTLSINYPLQDFPHISKIIFIVLSLFV